MSKINDRMAKLSDRKFHITNSPFPRFSALVDKVRKRERKKEKREKGEKEEKGEKKAPRILLMENTRV